MFGLAVVFWETVIIVSYLERWHLDVVSVLDASRQKVFGRGFDYAFYFVPENCQYT